MRRDEPRGESPAAYLNPWVTPQVDQPERENEPKTPQNYVPSEPKFPPARPVAPTGLPRDGFQTMRVGGGRNAEPSHKLLMLEYCHYIPGENETGWQGLEQVKGPKHVVGRESSFPPGSSLIDYLASDHLRILIEGNQVAVEEGITINGAYLNIPPRRPVELKAGTKFVVGEQVIVFELPEPPVLDPTVISLNQEKLRWQRLEPLAYLTFIGPGNDPGIRFPITKADQTTIGREGDIALGPDRVASRLHARVFLRGDRFYLEDMGSANGTFVRIDGRTTIKPGSNHSRVGGDELLIGAVLVRVMEY